MAKLFTLTEARALLPRVGRLIREAVEMKAEYQRTEMAMQAISSRIMIQGGMAVDRGAVLETRAARERAAESLKHAITAIHETGCEVKDLDIGLVDFPALFQGEEICLCWRLGEPDIEFWHGKEEGFAGRKRIDQEFLDQHGRD